MINAKPMIIETVVKAVVTKALAIFLITGVFQGFPVI